MANGGKDTNASQFFICETEAPWLDGKHAIFGRVSAGMDTVRRMGAVPTGANDRPTTEVKILRAVAHTEGEKAPGQP